MPFALLLLLAALLPAARADGANGAVIGVTTQPNDMLPQFGELFVPASYVDFATAGARAVPLQYNATDASLKEIVPQISGLLFPGGDANSDSQAELLFSLVIQENEKGRKYPIWATCDGFEWLVDHVANESVIHPGFDAENLSLPLHLTDAVAGSQLLGDASTEMLNIFAGKLGENVTMNLHHQGITPEAFAANAKLTAFFTVLATSFDRQGKEFVALIEAKDYPIFASQFHPEKPAHEFGRTDGHYYEAINHSQQSIRANQWLQSKFINAAVRNAVSTPDSVKLFMEYPSVYTGAIFPAWERTFFFNYTATPDEAFPMPAV